MSKKQKFILISLIIIIVTIIIFISSLRTTSYLYRYYPDEKEYPKYAGIFFVDKINETDSLLFDIENNVIPYRDSTTKDFKVFINTKFSEKSKIINIDAQLTSKNNRFSIKNVKFHWFTIPNDYYDDDSIRLSFNEMPESFMYSDFRNGSKQNNNNTVFEFYFEGINNICDSEMKLTLEIEYVKNDEILKIKKQYLLKLEKSEFSYFWL